MAPHKKSDLSLRERFRLFTPMLVFLTIYMALCAFNFGYDVGNFSGVQAMQPFAKKFGVYNEATQLYALPAYLSSVMTATPFVGKLIGALICGYVAERWGRKVAVFILACISLVGVTLQASATTAAQFTLGRIINFAMTGFCIVVCPIYQAECAPRELRGLTNSTIQMIIIFGQTVASLVNYGTQYIPGDASWQIPVSLQFIVPAILIALWKFMPESPRWLLSKDRSEEAARCLRRLRGYGVEESVIEAEISALRQALTHASNGPWAEVFDHNNRQRTGVAILAMFGQQITGQAFVNQYSTVFYQTNGFASQAFLFTVVANICGVVGTAMTWFVVDGFGRRPILFFGGFLMGAFLTIVAIISSVPNPSNAAKQTMVASMSLFSATYCMSWGPISYVVMGETAAARVREKTSLLACCISITTTFVTSFTLPYLLNKQYAALEGKVGFIYGGICFAILAVSYFCIPEMKGRSLEEIDELFAARIPLRKFPSYKTTPVEHLDAKDAATDDVAETVEVVDKSRA